MPDHTADTLSPKHLADVEFTIRWTSPEATHEEHYLARKLSPWRDILPPGFDTALKDARPGDTVRDTFIPGKLVPGQRPRKIAAIPRDCFKKFKLRGALVSPRPGRFYPYALLASHPGIRTSDVRPAFRVLDTAKDLTVDFNHPLAARELDVEARVVSVYPKARATRSKLPDWIEDICMDGPGMQARAPGQRTDFGAPDAFDRADPGEDAAFYATPRITAHIDAAAQGHLRDALAPLAAPGARILDLMAGTQSHLPSDLDAHVTGLGMNAEEMAANPALSETIVHDLNADPHLPCGDNAFDLVANNLSIEYLTDPAAIVAEAHRTLKPGGTIAISFSNRWFPEKATRLWTEIHEFERLGFVLDLLLDAGFSHCATLSIRNHHRPKDDPHYHETWDADPIYLATARK